MRKEVISKVLLTNVANAALGPQESCALCPPTCPFLLTACLGCTCQLGGAGEAGEGLCSQSAAAAVSEGTRREGEVVTSGLSLGPSDSVACTWVVEDSSVGSPGAHRGQVLLGDCGLFLLHSGFPVFLCLEEVLGGTDVLFIS